LQLRGDEVVLDAGCGTGRLTAELLEALPQGRVVGIDLSRNMLHSAREHLGQFGSRVSLVACDLLRLPFEQAFDGIVSTAAFHWVLDHDQLFANLRRALVPGGWLEAQCGGGPNLVRLRGRANALAATPKFAAFFEGFREPWLYEDAAGAAQTLRRAGFVDVETSTEAAPTVLEDAPHYKEFVRNIMMHGHLENIPAENDREEFIAALTAQAETDDPPFSLDYWRLNLRGRK
jgi:trans-aconitate methyltransferase